MDNTKNSKTFAAGSANTGDNDIILPDENISMEDLLKTSADSAEIPHLHAGAIVEGIFAGKTSDGYLFDIGHKREGIVPSSENIPQEILNSSTPVKLRVIKPFVTEGGNPILSWQAIMLEETISSLEDAYRNHRPIKGIITEKINGGYLVNVGAKGIRAFLPAKHLSFSASKKKESINRHIDCIILEMKQSSDRNQNASLCNIIVSEREAEKIARNVALEQIFKTKSVGDIVEGTITSIAKFGAFADIGGADALIHISDISWAQTEKIEDHLKLGQKIKARIKTMDTTNRKISLSIKDLTENPWDTITTRYSAGDIITAKVRNIAEFGVFCELENGVEGLLHISEIDWKNPNPPVTKLFKKGDTIKAKILAVDPAKRKISLSIKRLEPSPWEKLSSTISVGKNIEGVISRLTPFGAIVKVGDEIEGSLHVKNLDWFKKISHPSEILKTGERVTLNVIEFKPSEERLELSLKHTRPNPFKKYKKKTIVEFTISKVIPAGAFALLEEGVEAFVPRAELVRRKTDDIMTAVKAGDKLKGIVTESDETRRKIEISVRKYEISEEKKLLAQYSSDKPHPKLEDILSEPE